MKTGRKPAIAPDDLLVQIEERAAILEYDAGHQRDVADRLGREMVMGRDAAVAVADQDHAGILPADVADIHARGLPLVRDALRVFGGAVRRVGRQPDGADPRRTPTTPPGQCRCGHIDEWVQVPVHDGRSVRVDCGHCDRFGWFSVWHGRRMPSPFDHDETVRPPPLPDVSMPQPAVALVPSC
jgi:hypothetical protein